MDFNTTLNTGISLLIVSVKMIFQIKDWPLTSIHFWNSGICYMTW